MLNTVFEHDWFVSRMLGNFKTGEINAIDLVSPTGSSNNEMFIKRTQHPGTAVYCI